MAPEAETAPERGRVVDQQRAAWNESAPFHAPISFDPLLEAFRQPGFSVIQGERREALLREGLAGKAVVQPCCNNGRELLSIKNLGAARCVGFDVADAHIEQGARLIQASGIECELVRADVYEIPPAYHASFDIVYVSPGSLRCLPDLDGFFSAMVGLMRPRAWLFMVEMHPLVDVFGVEPSRAPRRLRRSYFDPRPVEIKRGLDYRRMRRYRNRPALLFHHKLSDVVQACLGSGLRLETLSEHPWDVSGGTYQRLQGRRAQLPLSFALTARHD